MRYTVVLTAAAQEQLLDTALWWSDNRSPVQAERWLAAFESEISKLGQTANRQPFAYESGHFEFDLRQLNFGVGSRPTHRAVFRIRGERVEVVAVRHLAQRELRRGDIAE